jgi:hypothetical protein
MEERYKDEVTHLEKKTSFLYPSTKSNCLGFRVRATHSLLRHRLRGDEGRNPNRPPPAPSPAPAPLLVAPWGCRWLSRSTPVEGAAGPSASWHPRGDLGGEPSRRRPEAALWWRRRGGGAGVQAATGHGAGDAWCSCGGGGTGPIWAQLGPIWVPRATVAALVLALFQAF